MITQTGDIFNQTYSFRTYADKWKSPKIWEFGGQLPAKLPNFR
jgi:hypothetical protein